MQNLTLNLGGELMKRICDCENLKRIAIEADVGADPTWCATCRYNIELNEFTISDQLKHDFYEWVSRFVEWIDWEMDTLSTEWEVKERQYNREGDVLSKRLHVEFGETYEIEFIPSKTIEEGHF